MSFARNGREGRIQLLVGIAIYCTIALLMEVVRAYQVPPGGAAYGFEQIERRLAAASPLTPAQKRGQIRYDHYCAICHGSEGHGDGGNAFQLNPKPRDFSSAAFRARVGNQTEMARVIREGGPAAKLSNLMPPWGLTLSGSEVNDLVAYVEYLSARTGPSGGDK